MGQAASSSTADDFSTKCIVLPFEQVRQSISRRVAKAPGYVVLPARRVNGSVGQVDAHGNVKIPYVIYGNKDNDVAFLHPDILERFLPVIFECLPTMLQVCTHWFITLYDFITRRWSHNVVANFMAKYKPYFHLERLSLSLQPLFTAEMHIRTDLLLYAKVLPACAGKCLELSYSHTLIQPAPIPSTESPRKPGAVRSQRRHQKTTFRVECLRKGSSRTVWIRKDTPRFHGDEIHVVGGPNTPLVCVDDRIEISINLSNGLGVVDTLDFTWLDPRNITDPEDRLLGQKCLLDAEGIQWYDYDSYIGQSVEILQEQDIFRPYWILKESEYSGVSVVISRSRYAVVSLGDMKQATDVLGIHFKVVKQNKPIIVPLKRLGLEHDRFSNHQIRIGDTVELFAVQGGPEGP